jgi:hypothetical protein
VAGSNFKTLRFFHMPDSGAGVKVFPLDLGGTFDGLSWEFPTDTTFGEMILVTDPQDGRDRTAQLRLRTKRPSGEWRPTVYQPFPTETLFRNALTALGVGYNRAGVEREVLDSRQAPTNHIRNIFFDESFNMELPALDRQVVLKLLDRPFEPDSGEWFNDGVVNVSQPSVPANEFSVMPAGYFGGHLPVATDSCMRCHEDAGRVVNRVGEQRWRLRGGDAIFSWHPFSPDGSFQLNERLLSILEE